MIVRDMNKLTEELKEAGNKARHFADIINRQETDEPARVIFNGKA
jgi:hypothetical protein